MKKFTDCGKRLELIREESSLSKKDFSEKIDFQLTSYYNLSNGNKNISIGILEAIAENFPWVNLHWLLTGEGEMRMGESASIHNQQNGTNNFVNVQISGAEAALLMEKIKNLEAQMKLKDEIIELLKSKNS